MINLGYAYLYVLVKLNHVEWVSNTAVGHLRDVYQTVVMHTNIYKGSKVGDVGNNTG